MLILTRRPVETIYIGEEVTVTVLGVVGNQVRFGIEAPRHITIDRAEIHEKKKRAAQAGGNPLSPDDARSHADGSKHGPGSEEGTRHVNGNVTTLKLHRP